MNWLILWIGLKKINLNNSDIKNISVMKRHTLHTRDETGET